MKITHCEHPRLVYNKYLGKKVLASCGMCAVCTTERKKKWISRMITEGKSWRFVRVINLDYNDEFIPRYELGEDEMLYEVQERFYKSKFNELDFKRNNVSLDSFNEIFESITDLKERENEQSYFYSRLYEHRLGVPHVDVRDLQSFFKRLNIYFKRYVTGEFHNFRYAYAAEYGSTTFRPHYHIILYFSDSRIASTLRYYCSKAWCVEGDVSRPLGHVKVERDRGHAASYISKYIVKPADIPKCYSHSALATFFTASRRPPLGSLPQSTEEVRALFFGKSCTRVVPQVKDGVTRPAVVPVGENLESRLFPKCSLYSALPVDVRTQLLRAAYESENFGKFVAKCFLRCCKVSDFGLIDLEDGRWYESINFITSNLSDKSYLLNYDVGKFLKDKFLVQDLEKVILRMTELFTKYHFLSQVYYCSRHIDLLHKMFDISFEECLYHIDRYYEKKELILCNISFI